MPGPGPGRGAVAVAGLLSLAAVAVLAAPGSVLARRGGPSPGMTDGAVHGATAAVGTAGPPSPRAPVEPTGSGPSPAGPAADPGAADPAGPAGVRLAEVRGGWRLEEGLETAAAVGLLAGTAWAAADAGDGTVPLVVIEAVEAPGPGAAVVTLLVAASGPDGPRTVRLVVPVRTGPDEVRPAGTPWVLPGPGLAPLPPNGRPLEDADLLASARAALDRVGLAGDLLVALEATDGWPFLTRLADGGDGPWLRWHLDRFVVTGVPLRRAAGMDEGTGGP